MTWHLYVVSVGYYQRTKSYKVCMIKVGKTRVAVNGYGVIGKRVATAVRLQTDMEVVSVADVCADWRLRIEVRLMPCYDSSKRIKMKAGRHPQEAARDLNLDRYAGRCIVSHHMLGQWVC